LKQCLSGERCDGRVEKRRVKEEVVDAVAEGLEAVAEGCVDADVAGVKSRDAVDVDEEPSALQQRRLKEKKHEGTRAMGGRVNGRDVCPCHADCVVRGHNLLVR
jgi:hypothetical protein